MTITIEPELQDLVPIITQTPAAGQTAQLRATITEACLGLSDVDPGLIAARAIAALYDGMPTAEVDPAQSLNLYMANPSGKKLDELYWLAWRLSVKTTYYLRSTSKTPVEKSTFTLPEGAEVANPFGWMSGTMDLAKEKNFFETRVIEYQTGGGLDWD